MKNVAKCDTWCELQNPVNHRVFERKLRPKPFGRGHVCLGVTHRVAPDHAPPWGCVSSGTETGLPCRWCGWPKKESPLVDARLVVVVKAFVSSRADQGICSLKTLMCRLTTMLRPRPQVRRDYPLSLSISISGGKETYKDSPSNGERTGNSPA
jgi:hypothetical protein